MDAKEKKFPCHAGSVEYVPSVSIAQTKVHLKFAGIVRELNINVLVFRGL